ncbi:MAG: hypothetical protein KJO41_00635 [Bacteroidia bacterium]|nr:hypothetical protein [Bacteroidia bacterium]NNK61094.1 hypothetical protein [Flavobacteriaceae bacterium]NNL32813.1 hypothetical protein [Flavobacteriaceae bacterium]RZW57317.1 MAG: hypothetical protein EX263_01085 [Flavobacteriaceae bacterium]
MSKFITLSTVSLNNNCPECFSTEGLELTFKQEFKENKFFRSITDKTTHFLRCTVCETDLFPVRWTEAIERVVDYHQKTITPKPKSLKLKRLAWVIILSIDALIILGVLIGFGVIKF